MLPAMGRYVLRQVLQYVLLTLLILYALFVFFDLLGELSDLNGSNYGIVQAVWYVLLQSSEHVYALLPVAVLIGGIFALSALAGNSEMVVMRAAGVSLARLVRWMLLLGAGFAVLTLLAGEVLVPLGKEAAQRYRMEVRKTVLSGNPHSGIWIKDGQQIANVAALLPDHTLAGLRILTLRNGTELALMREAERARYNGDGSWTLEKVRETRFLQGDAGVTLTQLASVRWDTAVNPEMLGVLLVSPNEMSITDLRAYQEHLERNRQSTLKYELAMWSKLFYPLAGISMLLIALPFALLQRRSGNVGGRIFLGILIGVAFNFFNRVVMHIGELYQLNAMMVNLLPSLTLFVIATWMLWRVEGR